MAKLIMVRHGQSVANAEKRFTHGPHEGLSTRGYEQARERARFLRAAFSPVALYCSHFVRAVETAAVLGDALALESRVVETICEQHFGALRGKSYDALANAAERTGLARWDYRPPGGETLREVAERVGPAVTAIAERHRGDEVVVVSHGGVMAALRAFLRGHYDEVPELSANASGYVLDFGETGFTDPVPLDPIAF